MATPGWAARWQGFLRLWKRESSQDTDEEVSPERLRRILAAQGVKLTPIGEAIVSGTYQPYVEYSDERFREYPAGHWETAGDYSRIMVGDVWTFRPDGTGEYVRIETPGHPDMRVRFVWEAVADCHIRVRALGEEIYAGEEVGFIPSPDDEPDDEPIMRDWQPFAYAVARNKAGETFLRGDLPLFPYVSFYEEPDGLRLIGEGETDWKDDTEERRFGGGC